jgi:hypothetical protein
MRSGSNMGSGGQGEGGAQWAWTYRKTQTPFIPYRIPTGVPMQNNSSGYFLAWGHSLDSGVFLSSLDSGSGGNLSR